MVKVFVDRDLEDLIPGFLVNRKRDTEKIDSALAANDLETIRFVGHSMKGSGGGYGFDYLSEIGNRIEQAAMAGDVPSIRTANEELRAYLPQIEVVFR
jgi:HPt (histidine-containing phosphotransfer) domain-containing protein